MPVKKARSTVSRIEWRLQDVNTDKIHHRTYPSEKRAFWHAKKFNEMGLRFNSPVRTRVVKVKSTYQIENIQAREPYKIKVIEQCFQKESKTTLMRDLAETGSLPTSPRKSRGK